MLLFDLILLVAVLACGGWRLIAPCRRPRLRTAAAVLGLSLTFVKWALHGYTWQDLPACILWALVALPPVRAGVVLRWIGRFVLVGVAAASMGVWILPAVPTLPRPDGRYAVATQVYRWTDAARDEPHTADLTDRRNVIAQAWYPTPTGARPSGRERLSYIDGIGRMPARVSAMPGFMLRRYGQIDTHAVPAGALASGVRPWPVVIFSPGYGAPRAVYTGLATRLASRGFVVFVLDHPYESAVTQLQDGRVVGLREIFPTDRSRYMPDQQILRAADIRFVMDQLARPEPLSPLPGSGRIDGSKVAVIGHSFGGAAAVLAMSEDPRVAAAANIDGTPYGDLPDRQLARPFLLLQSDYAETHHSDYFINGNARLLARSTAPGFRYEIKHANHYSFTDAPFFFAPPGRWLLSQVMGGGRGPAATHQATADILAAFLAGPLTGVPADLSAAAARYPGVSGGPVRTEHSAPLRRPIDAPRSYRSRRQTPAPTVRSPEAGRQPDV